MSISVFLADDHTIVRDGLRYLLEAHGGIKVVGEAGNGRDAVRAVKKLRPDVVVMDILMADLNGIEATDRKGIFSNLITLFWNLSSVSNLKT